MPSSGCGRQAVALCELTRLLVSDFFRIIPATTSRLNCSSRQVVARVCCFLRFCIKPMRYIYHPQLDCYLVAVNSDCSRPCELTLKHCDLTHSSPSVIKPVEIRLENQIIVVVQQCRYLPVQQYCSSNYYSIFKGIDNYYVVG